MNQDNPFAGLDDSDSTILKPMPGGRGPVRDPSVTPTPRSTVRPGGIPLPPRAGLNPLENAASALLVLLTRLKNTLSHPDPEGLRSQVIEEVKAFETKARGLGVDAETVYAARYVLCTALDEAVLSTPWGSTCIWRQQNLLITFHKETWGGEKFFLLLERLLKDPGKNLSLLELMYICLALGFQGRYRVLEGGYNQVEELRERLFQTVHVQRGTGERELSPHWRGVVGQRNPLIRYVPLWVISAVAGILLVLIYVGFSFRLNRISDPVFATLYDLGKNLAIPVPEPPPKPLPPEPVTPPPCALCGFLAPEVREGLVDVVTQPKQIIVRIRGDGLFDSGSATIKPVHQALLLRIAEALKTEPGKVLITGHTDNIPIKRSLRFPSNWHLSQQRAEAVVKMLVAAGAGAVERFTAEGRADKEPLVPNDTGESRAHNRRVEIVLHTPAKGS